jgi:sugar O-acyltransferase (sialic acid O-acetyltransferase NeuD family)
MNALYLCGAGNPEGVRLALTINRRHSRWDRIALLDDDPSRHGQSTLGVEIAGSFDLLGRHSTGTVTGASLVARTTARRWLARERIEGYGHPLARLVHPGVDTAGVELGEDLVVYQNAVLGPEVVIEDSTVVFMAGVVGHGSHVGRCCVVGPGAVINARARLGEGVYVGTNATVLPEVDVGPWATIGAGTVVMRSVPAGATVMGVPAKVVLTLEEKIKMRGFEFIPPVLLEELQGQVR